VNDGMTRDLLGGPLRSDHGSAHTPADAAGFLDRAWRIISMTASEREATKTRAPKPFVMQVTPVEVHAKARALTRSCG